MAPELTLSGWLPGSFFSRTGPTSARTSLQDSTPRLNFYRLFSPVSISLLFSLQTLQDSSSPRFALSKVWRGSRPPGGAFWIQPAVRETPHNAHPSPLALSLQLLPPAPRPGAPSNPAFLNLAVYWPFHKARPLGRGTSKEGPVTWCQVGFALGQGWWRRWGGGGG